MTSPYANLDHGAYWRSAVVEADPALGPEIYVPRHLITDQTRVFTAGSCFAQHVARAMKRAGCRVLDKERMTHGLPKQVTEAYGYGLYSARFGNIYTLRQFRQLVEESMGRRSPACAIWEKDSRFYDALRPSVEPLGLESTDLVREARSEHLSAVRTALQQAQVLVFTLGLTECWEHRDSGTVYPTAPGTIAGRYDPDVFSFRNLGYDECIDDFVELRGLLSEINPNLTFLLTVSPVPLSATATGKHVLTASTYSKSVLRAVCGALYDADGGVDYFPSFELMTAPHPDGHWFDANLRTPTTAAIDRAMACFLSAHDLGTESPDTETLLESDPFCEDLLLDAFAR